MPQELDIQPVAPRGALPALSLEQMRERHTALACVVKDILKEKHDFGIIPGTDRATLLKPGAEKLCTMFGLTPRFILINTLEDWDNGVFYYHYRCALYAGDHLVAESDGSANSKEKKYRWRTVYPEKATTEEKRLGRLETRKGRNGRSYQVYIVENTEPFDLINTLQKMAQKRALVACCLIAVNASDLFAQDLEDFLEEAPGGAGVEPESVPPFQGDVPRSPPGCTAPAHYQLTTKQITRIGEMIKQAGFAADDAGRQGARAFIAHLVGRDLKGVKDLTNDEASMVIDTLEGSDLAALAAPFLPEPKEEFSAKALAAFLSELGQSEEQQLQFVSFLFERPIKTLSELSAAERLTARDDAAEYLAASDKYAERVI